METTAVKISTCFFTNAPQFMMIFNNKSRIDLYKGNPAIYKDPQLSVPATRQIWLYLSCYMLPFYLNYTISRKRKSNVMNITTGNSNLGNLLRTEDVS